MVMPSQPIERSSRIGRPRDPAKVESILDASWGLFLAHGVEPVSVNAIAAEAGVAKATVYAYFPDKRALFQEGVRRETAKIEAAQSASSSAFAASNLHETLIAFGTGIMTFLTSDGTVDFYSSLSGDLRRDPDLARMFYDAGPGRTLANLTDILASPLAAELDIENPTRAAETLFGMWQGMSNYQLSLGVDYTAVIDGIGTRVSDGVTRFLRAYARS